MLYLPLDVLGDELSPFSVIFWMRTRPAGVLLSAAVMRALQSPKCGMVPVLGPCVRRCWHFLQFLVYLCASRPSGSIYRRRTCAGVFWAISTCMVDLVSDAGRL